MAGPKGADLVLSYLEAEEADADETVGMVEAEGRKAIRCPGDIRSEQSCEKIIDTAVEQVMKTNLYAMFWLCKDWLPRRNARLPEVSQRLVQQRKGWRDAFPRESVSHR